MVVEASWLLVNSLQSWVGDRLGVAGGASTTGLGGHARVFRAQLEPLRLNAPVEGPRVGLRGHIIVLNCIFMSQLGHMSRLLQLQYLRNTCKFIIFKIQVKRSLTLSLNRTCSTRCGLLRYQS